MSKNRSLLPTRPFLICAAVCISACLVLVLWVLHAFPLSDDARWMGPAIMIPLSIGVGIVLASMTCAAYEIGRRLYQRDFPILSPEQKTEFLVTAGVLTTLDALIPTHINGVGQHGFLTFAEQLAGCPRPTGWVRPLELVLGIGFIVWGVLRARKTRKDNVAKRLETTPSSHRS